MNSGYAGNIDFVVKFIDKLEKNVQWMGNIMHAVVNTLSKGNKT